MEIPLSQGKIALIDDDDWPRVANFTWYVIKMGRHQFCWYAASTVRKDDGRLTSVYMHRLVMQVAPGVKVDHRDHDGLNNQRGNLRLATHAQNMANRRNLIDRQAPYRGIYWRKGGQRRHPWGSQIKHHGRKQGLGYFSTAEEAARAYDHAARELFGEYAVLNFLDV